VADRPVETTSEEHETLADIREETMLINMGPQHPSTHGVLRMVLELDGENVVSVRPVVGYLHTGIEKNAEWRTWQQAVAYVTRMDYLSPFHNELAYCLSVERLLGIEAPPRARYLRVMLYGFRERETILDIFEMVTGLRMNHAFMRIGGLAMDLPDGAVERTRAFLGLMPRRISEYEDLLADNPIWLERNKGIGVVPAETLLGLGVTGPVLRAAGVPYDVRTASPYSGYEEFEFDVPVRQAGDCYARFEIRVEEMRQSLRIVEQCLDRLPDGPVKVEDPKLRFPGMLSVGEDGIGNDPVYLDHIMEGSMEALINHFKLVTQGIRVPAGEVFTSVESPRGELDYYVVSDGSNRPYRIRVRDPSFVNLQSLPPMLEGGLVADVIACVGSLDPVMGGVDR
jgi:NADH-quinone oxidoreductase subunit D